MNRSVIPLSSLALSLLVIPGYANIDIEAIRHESKEKVKLLFQQIRDIPYKRDRIALVDKMFRFVVFYDLAQAVNAEEVFKMPYACLLCPSNQSRSLEAQRTQIGTLDYLKLQNITLPGIAFVDLSLGCNIAPGLEKINCEMEDRGSFRQGYDKMGPLAEIFLEKIKYGDQIVLPIFNPEANLLAFPDSSSIPLYVDDKLNEAFFKKWFSNIYEVFDQNFPENFRSVRLIDSLVNELVRSGRQVRSDIDLKGKLNDIGFPTQDLPRYLIVFSFQEDIFSFQEKE
jgi:hypothetical protein